MSDTKDKVTGEVGFKDNTEEMLTKEETMFKVDNDGKAIPEKCKVLIYDRDLDSELIEESSLLLLTIKKQKAIKKIMAELIQEQEKENNELKAKIEAETDPKIKLELQKKSKLNKNSQSSSEVQTKINQNVVNEGISESREIIQQLKQKKKDQTIIKYAELMPCTVGEAHFAFKQLKTIEGKETNDWIADLISKKLNNPSYSLEEAKRLKPDMKIALKDAILQASGYKISSYRDIMMQRKLEEDKPKLAQKKEKTS